MFTKEYFFHIFNTATQYSPTQHNIIYPINPIEILRTYGIIGANFFILWRTEKSAENFKVDSIDKVKTFW